MDDKAEKAKKKAKSAAFKKRLAYALEMNGLDNAEFSARLGDNGQQNVWGWKDRGQIGAQSVRAVAALLPKTNMDWLQYGEGSPERFSVAAEPSHNHDVRQARPVRPVPEMLSSAYQYALIGLGLYAESRDLNLALLPDSVLLSDVYALIAKGGGELPGGEESPELRAVIEKHAGHIKRGELDERATPAPKQQQPGNGR